jgi:Ca2+-binding RTX toxin-like protein
MVTFKGTKNDDTLHGSLDSDKMTGLSGHDALYGSGGNDIIEGGAGNDYLFGEGGDDIIEGGTGNDYLVGGAGDNLYRPGSGDDVVDNWDGGKDTLVLENAAKGNFGYDTFYNYNSGDTIEFKGYASEDVAISSNVYSWEEYSEYYNEETGSWEYNVIVHEHHETVFDFTDGSRLSVSGTLAPQVGVDYFFT